MLIKAETIDDTMNDIAKLQMTVDKLLKLGDSISLNKIQLSTLLDTLRRAEINSQFITIAEAAEALHCSPKRAVEYLKQRNVEIIDAGKTYVIYRKAFDKSFEGGSNE